MSTTSKIVPSDMGVSSLEKTVEPRPNPTRAWPLLCESPSGDVASGWIGEPFAGNPDVSVLSNGTDAVSKATEALL